MSNIVHKVKDALSSHKDHSTSTTGDETETDHSRNETHQQFDNNDTDQRVPAGSGLDDGNTANTGSSYQNTAPSQNTGDGSELAREGESGYGDISSTGSTTTTTDPYSNSTNTSQFGTTQTAGTGTGIDTFDFGAGAQPTQGTGTTQRTTQGYNGNNLFNGTSLGNSKDPTDAAHVPPSVMSNHIGNPEGTHGRDSSDHMRRHSLKTAESLQQYGGGSV